jgi:hypothetical protein
MPMTTSQSPEAPLISFDFAGSTLIDLSQPSALNRLASLR